MRFSDNRSYSRAISMLLFKGKNLLMNRKSADFLDGE